MEQPRLFRQELCCSYISDLVQVGLESMGRGKINLPNDYQYDNARPGEQLNAKTIFGLATFNWILTFRQKAPVPHMPTG